MTRSVPFVDLAAQEAGIVGDLRSAFDRLLERRDWILGEDVAAFEAEFASFSECKHAVGTDSGLSALELCLLGYGIGPGDEVITAANTFTATVLAIAHVGATPVLVDVDPESYCLAPELVEEAVTERTRAIVPVHLYGHPADIDPLVELAEAKGLVVIEDACQAHGARYKGRRAGSLGQAAAFSFYPAKNLGAFGDGGIIVTDDDELVDRLRVLRNYGQRVKNEHEEVGYNRRLDTLQAAFLRLKLPLLEGWNQARREAARTYDELLDGAPVVRPTVSPDVEPVWHLYVVRTADREALQEHLAERGIATGVHYPTPVHLQPAHASMGYALGSFPVSERYADQVLSLPMYPTLARDDLEHVADAVHAFQPADRLREAFENAVELA